MIFLKGYKVKEAGLTKKGDSRPLINSKVYRMATLAFAGISAGSTGYFMSYLAKLAGVAHPANLISGGIIAIGLTIAYISKEFNGAIDEYKNGKKPVFVRLNNSKFIYFVRFTTVMGACMLLYAGIDLNDRNQVGRNKAISLVEDEIERRKIQEQDLLSRSIVSATDSTVSRDLNSKVDKLVDMYSNQKADHTAFLDYMAEITPLSYKALVILFVAALGLGVDFGISILTRQCAALSLLSLEAYFKEENVKEVKRSRSPTLQTSKGPNNIYRMYSNPITGGNHPGRESQKDKNRRKVLRTIERYPNLPRKEQAKKSGLAYNTFKKYVV